MQNNEFLMVDGEVIPSGRPAVRAESRGLMYGDGCFETVRTYKGSPFKLPEHVSRLKEAAEYLGIRFPEALETDPLRSSVLDLAGRNGLADTDAVVRVQLWRGGARGYGTAPEDEGDTRYSIMITPLPDIPHSITLSTVSTRRIPDAALSSRFKLCNNINYIKAAGEAAGKGADDALMLTVNEHISETTIANIFWLDGNTVYTPSASCDILPGITRGIILDILRQNTDCRVQEGVFEIDHLLAAGAAWICNSVREIVPVRKVDETRFKADHSLIRRLKKEYERVRKDV